MSQVDPRISGEQDSTFGQAGAGATSLPESRKATAWSVAHHHFVGTLVHERFLVPAARFCYRMRLLGINLDQADALFKDTRWWSMQKPALGWLRRKDFLDEFDKPLPNRVRSIVGQTLGREFNGPVYLLTAPRCFGFGFNPLTVYFCFESGAGFADSAPRQPTAMLAEVHNTPWLQRHTYVIDLTCPESHVHAKAFHVSPFLPMNMDYCWKVDRNGDFLRIGIENRREGQKAFRAILTVNARILTAQSLDRELWLHWPQSLKTLCGIYWQALKIIARRATFYGHPGKHAAGSVAARQIDATVKMKQEKNREIA